MSWLTHEVPHAWRPLAEKALAAPSWHKLGDFLQEEICADQEIFPARDNWFAVLRQLDPQDVRVVIVGQDPYHGTGEAHGLSFSVPQGVKVPPSLRNIFKEISRDFGHPAPAHGCLQGWVAQGVLLLNSSLTVRADQAGSHAKKGWEPFTDALIAGLAQEYSHLVFMLWGAHAQKKVPLIDANRHRVLLSAHPSPLSAHRGFIGNGHFSAANDYLEQHGRLAIDWRIN